MSGFHPAFVAVLVLLSAVAPLSTDMYLAAFPQMAVELGTSASMIQLTLTAFMVGLGVGQLIIGPLSDSMGRRRLLLVCIAVCLGSGVVCALAPSPLVLIAGRLIQGFTGGAGMVLGRAIVADLTRGPTTLRLMNALMAAGAIAAVIAPVIGGQIVAWSGWRMVFWVISGVMAFLLGMAAWAVPESLAPEKRRSVGFAEFGRGMGAVLSNRAYVAYLVTSVGSLGAFFAYISGSPFVLQEYMGLGVRAFALVFGVNAVGLVLVTFLSVRLVGRMKAVNLVRVGVATVGAAGIALLVLASVGLPTIPTLVALFVATASQGLVGGNVTGLGVSQTPDHVGAASALLGALPFGFSAILMPIVGLGFQPRTLAIVMLSCSVVALAAITRAPRSHAGTAAG